MRHIIDCPQENEETILLKFGGTRPDGECLSVNSRYFSKNGKPWISVMGEFHFSRWPADEWERSLRKMRAGGVEIVATYIFWIHHEEERGVWNFSGCRNLRQFLSICKKLNFPVLLRIGPWAHGECRNGGFPDWVQNAPAMKARTNDAAYLSCVKLLFGELYAQAKGLLWKDNGPVVGIQMENEYGNCGSDAENMARRHMLELKKLALECGFVLPLYTATDWGGAAVVDGEELPVLGGYVDAPWEQNILEMPESENFLLGHAMNDPTIGSDLKAEGAWEFSYSVNDYPYLTAELGGGMQVTKHRRVVATAADTEALAFCKLGSGANLLGYYMYHGGTNPDGKLSTLQESKETGYPNDLPVKSYDFQAPISEAGELHQSYRRLKRLHLFLEEWGELLAPAVTVIPDFSATVPGDLETLRLSVRHNAEKDCGFVFINNHLRKRTLAPHDPLDLTLVSGKTEVSLPTLHINDGDVLLLPYRLPMGGAMLSSTNAQPLTRIGSRYFFSTDSDPIYRFEGDKTAEIITLTNEQSRNAWKFGDRLYITNAGMTLDCGELLVEGTDPNVAVTVYEETGAPYQLTASVPPYEESTCEFALAVEENGIHSYDCTLTYDSRFNKEADVILNVDYIGDKAEVYADGRLSADWFTTGLPFRTALRRINFPRRLTIKVYPSEEDIYFDLPVKKGCTLNSLELVHLYCQKIK